MTTSDPNGCCNPSPANAHPSKGERNAASDDTVRGQVREGYAEIARAGGWSAAQAGAAAQSCCTPGGGCCGPATFTPDQLAWLKLIRDHIATSLSIELDDLDYTPFNQEGGLGKAHQLFGDQLPKLLEELNEALAA